MEPYNDGWLYSGSACERLANKSAIGRKIGEKLLLSSAEVIFCHNHRHLDWPYDNWFEEEIIKNPPSRSAKLRFASRNKNIFNEPSELKNKFKKYIQLEETNG